MTDPLSSIGIIFAGLFGEVGRIVIGLGILGLIGFIIWHLFLKPKPVNMADVVFNKFYEATAERLGLNPPKRLALCPMAISRDEIQKMPVHQIHHNYIGPVVGINVMGVITSYKTLLELCKKPSDENFKKLLEENKEAITADKFWILFAYKRQTGSKFFIPRVKKSLLLVKESQIINLNSIDGVIRVRGYGLTPIGMYELINDENSNVSRLQLIKDQEEIISGEITLASYSKLGEIVEGAIKSDPNYRKEAAIRGISVQMKQDTPEPP